MGYRSIYTGESSVGHAVKAAVTRLRQRVPSAEEFDATLRRLEESNRQSAAAVARAKNTAAQEAARQQRFQQGRPIATPLTPAQQAAQAQQSLVRKGPPLPPDAASDRFDFIHNYDRNPQSALDKEMLTSRMESYWGQQDKLAHPERDSPVGRQDMFDRSFVQGGGRVWPLMKTPTPLQSPFHGYALRHPEYRGPMLHADDMLNDLRFERQQSLVRQNQERLFQGIKQAPMLPALKSALRGMRGAIKQGQQQPNIPALQAALRRNLAGSPGYITGPAVNQVRAPAAMSRGRITAESGIEPTPPGSGVSVGLNNPTPLNWARYENSQQLRQMLGRKPTPEERSAAMQVRRQLATEAGQPFQGINPENYPPQYGPWGLPGGRNTGKMTYLDWPATMTNAQQDTVFDTQYELTRRLGHAPTPQELQAYHRRQSANSRVEGLEFDPDTGTTTDWGAHPIHPNANIRNPRLTTYADPESFSSDINAAQYEQLNIDPRVPERYNRTLPPDKQMSQDQLDAIRRAYYTRYPDLVPVEGQPGYNQWKKQVLRGK